MNANGTSPVRLTASIYTDHEPTYSPDGTKIAFWRDSQDGDTDIYIMSASGGSQTRLTFSAVDDRSPSWQPLP